MKTVYLSDKRLRLRRMVSPLASTVGQRLRNRSWQFGWKADNEWARLRPMRDSDGDGVPNARDCFPLDPKRQDVKPNNFQLARLRRTPIYISRKSIPTTNREFNWHVMPIVRSKINRELHERAGYHISNDQGQGKPEPNPKLTEDELIALTNNEAEAYGFKHITAKGLTRSEAKARDLFYSSMQKHPGIFNRVTEPDNHVLFLHTGKGTKGNYGKNYARYLTEDKLEGTTSHINVTKHWDSYGIEPRHKSFYSKDTYHEKNRQVPLKIADSIAHETEHHDQATKMKRSEFARLSREANRSWQHYQNSPLEIGARAAGTKMTDPAKYMPATEDETLENFRLTKDIEDRYIEGDANVE